MIQSAVGPWCLALRFLRLKTTPLRELVGESIRRSVQDRTSNVPVLSGATLPSSIAPAASLQVSRNGRYLAAGNTVLDRNTGTLQVVTAGGSGGITPLPVGGRFGIGNNGGLLYLVLHKAFIVSTVDLVLSDRPATTIVNSSVVYTAVVSAAENRVVYEISGNTSLIGRQLWSYDMNSGQSTKLEDFDFGTFIGVSQ